MAGCPEHRSCSRPRRPRGGEGVPRPDRATMARSGPRSCRPGPGSRLVLPVPGPRRVPTSSRCRRLRESGWQAPARPPRRTRILRAGPRPAQPGPACRRDDARRPSPCSGRRGRGGPRRARRQAALPAAADHSLCFPPAGAGAVPPYAGRTSARAAGRRPRPAAWLPPRRACPAAGSCTGYESQRRPFTHVHLPTVPWQSSARPPQACADLEYNAMDYDDHAL